MILGLLSLLRGWQFVDRLITKVAGHFTTWPADEFSSFMTTRPDGELPAANEPSVRTWKRRRVPTSSGVNV